MKLNINFSIILITIILCILKIANIINISWWWCFGLIWVPYVILFAILGLIVVVAILFSIAAVIIEIFSNR